MQPINYQLLCNSDTHKKGERKKKEGDRSHAGTAKTPPPNADTQSNLRQNENHYKISKFYTKWRGNRDNLDNRRKGGTVPQIETKMPQM